jgi:DNA-binding NarL/FixJ family response regulator
MAESIARNRLTVKWGNRGASILAAENSKYSGLIGEGYGTRQIAEQLHLRAKTIEAFQSHIKK